MPLINLGRIENVAPLAGSDTCTSARTRRGTGRWRARTAAWAAVLIVLLLCGPPALPFVAFALVVTLLWGGPTRVAGEITALALAAAIALAALSPRLVLDRHSTEPDAPPPPVSSLHRR